MPDLIKICKYGKCTIAVIASNLYKNEICKIIQYSLIVTSEIISVPKFGFFLICNVLEAYLMFHHRVFKHIAKVENRGLTVNALEVFWDTVRARRIAIRPKKCCLFPVKLP